VAKLIEGRHITSQYKIEQSISKNKEQNRTKQNRTGTKQCIKEQYRSLEAGGGSWDVVAIVAGHATRIAD
jgi:hypothetical protein